MIPNQCLVLVLNKIEILGTLLDEFYRTGVTGATVINSTGMAHALAGREDSHMISSLRIFFSHDREENKTVFLVCDDEKAKIARDVIHRVAGDLSKPNTAILFSVPLLFSEGIIPEEKTKI